MQITPVHTTPSQRRCVTGTFHQPLPATATAKPVTQAIAAMTSPCASRKLRSLGTSASTRSSAPANQAQENLRVLGVESIRGFLVRRWRAAGDAGGSFVTVRRLAVRTVAADRRGVRRPALPRVAGGARRGCRLGRDLPRGLRLLRRRRLYAHLQQLDRAC